MIIAIDPDLRKSGVAIFSPDKHRLTYVGSLPLWEVFDLIEGAQNAVTVIEQSPHTNTWHKGGKGAAVNVGKNLAISILLVDFCKAKGLGYVTIPPNGYSHYYCVAIGGKNRFLEREFKRDHQWEKQTNKDSRAAVGMIYSNRHLHKSWLREVKDTPEGVKSLSDLDGKTIPTKFTVTKPTPNFFIIPDV